MALYARSELKVLLALAGVVLVGLAAREWRAGFPEHAERLERFDREPVAALPAAPGVESAAAARAASGQRSSGSESEPSGPGRSRAEPAERAHPKPIDDPRPLDLNRATAAELARLPGVGPSLAGRIVADRERAGPFGSPEALRRVLGVGPRKLAAIRSLVIAGDDRDASGSATASPTVPADEEQSRGEVAEPPGTTPAEAFSDVGGP
jgi:competence ComEA-like helix-hairpin-helix protein